MTTKRTAKKGDRHVPAALARNAAKLSKEKRVEVLAAAHDDLVLIQEKLAVITDAFYDIGLALHRLAKPDVVKVLGYQSFSDLVKRGLGMSVSGASELMDIVTWIRRPDALRWRREKSAALIELAKATPAIDSPASLMKKPLKLGSGRVFDPRKADAEAIRAAAIEERQARAGDAKPARGVTSTKSERAHGVRFEKALHSAGLKEARVTVVARPKDGSFVRIERVPLAKLDVLARVAHSVHAEK